MQKKTLWTVVIIVVVLIVGGGAYGLFHKSSSSTSNSSSAYSSGGGSTATSTQNAAAVNNSVLATKTDATVGQYLADPSGKALYTYDSDGSNASYCTSSCLASWPAYIDTGATTGLPTNVTVFKRTDNGKMQYAYKNMPLYYFAGDTAAGQVTGNGDDGFSVAKP